MTPAELIKLDPQDADVKEYAELILSQGDRAVKLIQKFNETVRCQSEEPSQVVDPPLVVKRILGDLLDQKVDGEAIDLMGLRFQFDLQPR